MRISSKKGARLDNKKGASLGNRVQQKNGARLGKFGAKLGNSLRVMAQPISVEKMKITIGI